MVPLAELITIASRARASNKFHFSKLKAEHTKCKVCRRSRSQGTSIHLLLSRTSPL